MARIDFFVDANVLIYKTSDAIIAATAKCFNSQLLTADKDFEKISDDVDIVILDLI